MMNKELRELSRKQLNGCKLDFSIITLLVYVLISVVSFITRNHLMSQVIQLIVFLFIKLIVDNIYLIKVREGKISIKKAFKAWRKIIEILLITVIILLTLVIIVALDILLFSLIFQYPKFGFTPNSIGSVTLVILMYVSIIIILIYSYINFMPIILLNLDGADILESLTRAPYTMYHNRWKFIKLTLSFMGWFLLILITFGLASLWVVPYYKLTVTNFYIQLIK